MDWSAMADDDLMAFFRGGAAGVTRGGRLLAERYDLSECRSLADIGGGSGHFALAVVAAYPGIQATVVDLPNVTRFAGRFIQEAGMADRVSVVSADITREPLTGSFDIAVLKGVLQTLSAEEARAALRNVAPAIVPGGMLQIHGRMLDDSRLSPPDAVGMNMVFLNLFDGGQSHTEREHREWLREAGFVDVVRDRLPDGVDVLIARMPG
jgi:cyclopropane fatty-acyl-phospholipid synthase-like methyltransferase